MIKSFRWGALALALAIAIAAVFQNCSPMQAASDDGGAKALSSFISGASISWSMLAKKPEYNRFDRVQRWGDLQGLGVNLYPPLIPNTQTLNLDLSALRETKNGFDYLRLGPDASLAPAVADVSEFVFDQLTFLMVIRDIELPAQADGPLRLFGLYPANGDAAGVLVIDATASAGGGIDFTAYEWFDGSTYSTRRISVPEADLKGPIAIAARFSKAAGEMQFAINGKLSEGAADIHGTVPVLGMVARSFILHSASGTFGFKGGFSLGEVALHSSGKSDAELVSISSQLAHLWGSDVAVVPGPSATPVPEPTAIPLPTDGAELYNMTCANCHGSLNVSTKRGKTLEQINNAIRTVPQMSGFSTLTQAQREALVNVLK